MTQESNIVIPEVETSINEWLARTFEPCVNRYHERGATMENEGGPYSAPVSSYSGTVSSAVTNEVPF